MPIDKEPGAFKTIGELSEELGVAQHILRYWETKFPQLRPLQRAGNRRYYRPADVALARRIHHLLSNEGYTVRGVQKLLSQRIVGEAPPPPTESAAQSPAMLNQDAPGSPSLDVGRLAAVRDKLRSALAD